MDTGRTIIITEPGLGLRRVFPQMEYFSAPGLKIPLTLANRLVEYDRIVIAGREAEMVGATADDISRVCDGDILAFRYKAGINKLVCQRTNRRALSHEGTLPLWMRMVFTIRTYPQNRKHFIVVNATLCNPADHGHYRRYQDVSWLPDNPEWSNQQLADAVGHGAQNAVLVASDEAMIDTLKNAVVAAGFTNIQAIGLIKSAQVM